MFEGNLQPTTIKMVNQSLSKFSSIMSKENLQKSGSKTSNTSKNSASNESFVGTSTFVDSRGVPSFIIEDLENIYQTAIKVKFSFFFCRIIFDLSIPFDLSPTVQCQRIFFKVLFGSNSVYCSYA